MSKQQRDAIDAAMRAEPFDLNQSTAEHRSRSRLSWSAPTRPMSPRPT
jgi:hypothetical protein